MSPGENIQSEQRGVRLESATNHVIMFSPTQPLPAVGNMLVLESLEEDDEGTYVCRAANTAGTAEQRLQVVVEPGNSQRQQEPIREYQPPPPPEQYYQ